MSILCGCMNRNCVMLEATAGWSCILCGRMNQNVGWVSIYAAVASHTDAWIETMTCKSLISGFHPMQMRKSKNRKDEYDGPYEMNRNKLVEGRNKRENESEWPRLRRRRNLRSVQKRESKYGLLNPILLRSFTTESRGKVIGNVAVQSCTDIWIEMTDAFVVTRAIPVAPYAGAWIEIWKWYPNAEVLKWRATVAPHVGAWIEIDRNSSCQRTVVASCADA